MTVMPFWMVIVAASQVPAVRPAPAGPQRGKSAGEIIKASGVKAGLCVHLGATDGKLSAALGRQLADAAGEGGWIVQGLAGEAESVAKARDYIQSQRLYGKVSVIRSSLKRLPYGENLVNLAVAEDLPALLGQGLDLNEVARVLAPNGVLCFAGTVDAGKLTEAAFKDVRAAGTWTVAVKPRPKEMDDWCSFNHGPDQNRVSQDLLIDAAPTRLRWFHWSQPWFRDTIRGWRAAGGRLFYIKPAFNSGFTIMSYKGAGTDLIALDAYNGLLLWKRRLQRDPRVAARQPQNLAADADRFYIPIDSSGVPTALDAATGKVVRTYKEAGPVAGFLLHDGKLFTRGPSNTAIDAGTGEVLWKNDTVGVSLIAEGRGYGIVYERNEPDKLTCLDLATGEVDWQVPLADPSSKYSRPFWFYYKGVLIFTHILPRIKGKREIAKGWLVAYSPKDGRQLWTYDPQDVTRVSPTRKGAVFGVKDLVWAYVFLSNPKDRKYPSAFVGLDPATGKEKVRHDYMYRHVEGHYRCGMHYATERFFLAGTYEFFDWKTGTIFLANAIRSGCGLSGMLPANGLIYTPDRHCKCWEFMQKGFTAAAPSAGLAERTGERLEPGPAGGAAPGAAGPAGDGDWPMYRHDPARSGATTTAVPTELKPLWEGQAGRALTAPTIAEGMVFVASMDEHRLVAMDAETGEPRWSYMAGGCIDSPPTIRAGLAVFGCRDGYVYCLRARDGELAWRFRAAPTEEQIVVDGRLESAWPVHGSVLVLGDVACFAAGWHTALDGGVTLYAVKLPTGRLIWKRRYEATQASSPGLVRKIGFPAGLLTSDGQMIYMKNAKYGIDPKSGKRVRRYPTGRIVNFGLSGFRDDCWWSWENGSHRFQWSDGRVTARMLASGSDISCAIFPQWPQGKYGNSFVFHGMGLFGLCGKRSSRRTREMDWVVQVPSIRMRAMAMAGGTVFVAGRTDHIPELREFAQMKEIPRNSLYEAARVSAELGDERRYPKDGRLMAFATADGKKLGEVKLPAPPVFDGLAAANGRLYMSCLDGKLRCLGGK